MPDLRILTVGLLVLVGVLLLLGAGVREVLVSLAVVLVATGVNYLVRTFILARRGEDA